MAAASNEFWRRTLRMVLLLVGAPLCAPGVARALPPPGNISGTADCQKITISADPVPGAIGYVVRIYVEDYLPPLPDTTIATLPFLDYAPPGEKRSYQLATMDGSGVGPFSAVYGQYFVGSSPQAGVLLGPHAVLTGSPLTLNATTSQITSGVLFTWRKDGVVFPNGNQPVFQKTAALADSGTYTMEASSACDSSTTPPFAVHVANAVLPPTNITATAMCDSIRVTWAPRSGAWAYVLTRQPSFPGTYAPLPGPKVTSNQFIDHPGTSQTYRYSVASVVYDSLFGTFATSNQATPSLRATILPPEPADKTVEAGTNVSFSVAALGSGPITYTWRENGIAIQTGPSSNLVIANVQPANSGTYDLIACTNCGCDTTRAFQLTVCVTPSVDVPTAARRVGTREGTDVTLTAAVSGTATLQWFRGSAAIADGPHYSGATTNALTIINPQAPDADYYHLVATGNCQAVQGPYISLEISPCYEAPVITQQPPARQQVAPGDAVTLSVGATCCAPITYRWVEVPQDNSGGYFIPGASGPTLTIDPVTNGSFGTYICEISNRYLYADVQPSVVASSGAPVFTSFLVFPDCNQSTVDWQTDVPVNATLRYWTGDCDEGASGTIGPSSLETSGTFQVPIPDGQKYFARVEGVTAGNQTGRTYCALLAPRSSPASITGWLSFQPHQYYTGLPGGGVAFPMQYFLKNEGCAAFDGEIDLTSPSMDGVQQVGLKANGDPAFPSSLLPGQIAAFNLRSSDVFYVQVTPPPPGIVLRYTVSAKIVLTPTGGSPVSLNLSAYLYLTADSPQ